MLKITDDNYEVYKRTMETIWELVARSYFRMDPNANHSPLAVLNAIEKQSKSIAKRSLKSGLSDFLFMLGDAPADLKKEINEQLLERKLPSLHQLLSTLRDTTKKVLKRGKIKSEDEYYVIKEFLSDVDSSISDDERTGLGRILDDFEIND